MVKGAKLLDKGEVARLPNVDTGAEAIEELVTTEKLPGAASP